MAKSRFISIVESERSEIIYERIKTKSKIRTVNKMLKALKESGMYDESIAVENMFDYLTTKAEGVRKTKAGYISTVGLKTRNTTQITALVKKLSDFISNKTSTPSGMEQLYEERRRELSAMIDDEEFVKQLSKKDIKDIYKVFQSDEYDKENSRFASSTFFRLYTEAIDKKKSKEWFINQMQNYKQIGNDQNLKQAVSDIYDKYIAYYSGRE